MGAEGVQHENMPISQAKGQRSEVYFCVLFGEIVFDNLIFLLYRKLREHSGGYLEELRSNSSNCRRRVTIFYTKIKKGNKFYVDSI